MTTSIDDPEIDYHSSFEFVEADEKFETIENLDEKNSENFQLISKKGKTEREVNVNEDSMSILKSIIGRWKPLPSTNFKDFSQRIKLSEKDTLMWEHGIMVFEAKDGGLRAHFRLRSEIVGSHDFKPNEQFISKHSKVVYQVENNILKTKCTSLRDGKELWRIERFVKNGELTIVNDHGEFKCERKYQRVVCKIKKSSIN